MKKSCFVLAILPMLSSPVIAQNPQSAEGLLEKAIKCDHEFQPEFVIKTLQNSGVIGRKPIFQGDGIPTYLLKKPVNFHGLQVMLVEAWSYNGEMFSRGPGTAPPVHLALGFNEGDADKLKSIVPDNTTKKFAGKEFSNGFLYTSDSNYSRKVNGTFKSYPIVTCTLN